MAQASPWDEFSTPVAAQAPGGAGGLVPVTPPRQPAPQTPTQSSTDDENLRRIRLENEARERELAAGAAAQAAENERKASAFLIRAFGANRDYERTGVGPRSWAGQVAADNVPNLLNSLPGGIGNSPERQVADSAQNEFIAATLRQDSGAAIPEEELERQRRIYFPMPGDGPEVIDQKRQARRRALEGLINSAGRSLRPEDREAYDRWARETDGEQTADDVRAAFEAARRRQEQSGAQPPGNPPSSGAGDRPPGWEGQPAGRYDFYFGTPEEQKAASERDEAREAEARRVEEEVRLRNSPEALDAGLSALYGVPTIGPLVAGARQLFGDESTMAGVRGAQNVASFGLNDEIGAVARTAMGGTLADNLAAERGIDAYDTENNFGARLTGQLAGGFAIPTSVTTVARNAAEMTLRSGGSEMAALAAARSAATRRLAAEGAAVGGGYGFGSADGDILDRVAHSAVSAAIGGAAGAGLGAAGGRLAARRAAQAPAEQEQIAAAQAAAELGVRMPRFVAGGDAAQAAGARAEQSVFGGPVIRGAAGRMVDDSAAARDRIATNVGQVVEPEAAGEAAARGARAWRTASNAEGRRLYADAERRAAGVDVTPQETMQTLSRLIREEREVPGGTDALPIVERYASAFEQGGGITIDGARRMRTTLRNRLGETMSPSNADRITNQIMDAVTTDIETSLSRAGRDDAIAAYRQADRFWRERMTAINDLLRPIVGKDGDNWGAQAVAAIQRDTRGNGARLGQFLRTIPEEDANSVRASIISRLGQSTNGRQNAAGDGFSLDTFLTNWNEIRGSRDHIFDPATRRSLNHLALVAQRAKAQANRRGHSNSGAIIGGMLMGAPTMTGAGVSIGAQSPTALAVGVLLTAGAALRQWNGARLLASPRFAERLARTPQDAVTAARYWSRPWVAQLARTEPAIASEILGFQQAMLRAANDNASSVAMRSAAESNTAGANEGN